MYITEISAASSPSALAVYVTEKLADSPAANVAGTVPETAKAALSDETAEITIVAASPYPAFVTVKDFVSDPPITTPAKSTSAAKNTGSSIAKGNSTQFVPSVDSTAPATITAPSAAVTEKEPPFQLSP